jgi:KDO2-lipid IV(A) lauroyltransferase
MVALSVSNFLAFLAYAAARVAIFPFQIGSLRWARRLGAGLGLLCYYVLPIRRGVIRRNLTAYFGAEWSEARMRRGVRDAYVNFGMAVGEFAFGERLTHDNVEHTIAVEGLEHYRAAHASGRPVILYGAHQTMWELSQCMLHWCREPFIVVMKRIHNPYLNAYLTRRRSVFGAEMISQRGAVGMLEEKSGAKNINFGFFVDQRAAKGKGVWVNIRGNAVSAMAGPAVLAVRYGGLAILPTQMLRSATGIIIRFHAPISYALTGDERADVQRVTQLINDRVTAWVVERPEEYFWFHNRFKIHPAEQRAAEAFLASNPESRIPNP